MRWTRETLEAAVRAGADLSGADLSGANLIGADLSGVRLKNAQLSDANLIGARLMNANLTGASLSGAKLSDANLVDAELTAAGTILFNGVEYASPSKAAVKASGLSAANGWVFWARKTPSGQVTLAAARDGHIASRTTS